MNGKLIYRAGIDEFLVKFEGRPDIRFRTNSTWLAGEVVNNLPVPSRHVPEIYAALYHDAEQDMDVVSLLLIVGGELVRLKEPAADFPSTTLLLQLAMIM